MTPGPAVDLQPVTASRESRGPRAWSQGKILIALNVALLVATVLAVVLLGSGSRSSVLVMALLGFIVVNQAALLWAADGPTGGSGDSDR